MGLRSYDKLKWEGVNSSFICYSQDQLNSKSFPEFESYIVEEEEGSGNSNQTFMW